MFREITDTLHIPAIDDVPARKIRVSVYFVGSRRSWDVRKDDVLLLEDGTFQEALETVAYITLPTKYVKQCQKMIQKMNVRSNRM